MGVIMIEVLIRPREAEPSKYDHFTCDTKSKTKQSAHERSDQKADEELFDKLFQVLLRNTKKLQNNN